MYTFVSVDVRPEDGVRSRQGQPQGRVCRGRRRQPDQTDTLVGVGPGSSPSSDCGDAERFVIGHDRPGRL